MRRSFALAVFLIAAPAVADEIPGMHLVCVGTRPHMHHVSRTVVHFIPHRPSIRHHSHAKRICRHAYQRCHWEEDLGGPAGAESGWGGFVENGEGASSGDDVGDGLVGFSHKAVGRSAAEATDAFDAAYTSAKVGLFDNGHAIPADFPLAPLTPLIPQPPVVPPTVPEPSTFALMALGLASLGFLKWRGFVA